MGLLLADDHIEPLTQLRLTLAEAKRAGLEFEAVWPDAVEGAIADCANANTWFIWHDILDETRDVWESAYRHRESRLTCLTEDLCNDWQ